MIQNICRIFVSQKVNKNYYESIVHSSGYR